MSDAPGPEPGAPEPPKLTQSQIKLRRGTRFFFESGANKPPQPISSDGEIAPTPEADDPSADSAPSDPASPVEPSSEPASNAGADAQNRLKPGEVLPAIDDNAPTRIINPASLKTMKFSDDPTADEPSESRPTVMKGDNIERLPKQKTTGNVRLGGAQMPPVSKPTSPAPATPTAGQGEDDLGKFRDRDLIFGHLKNRPPSGVQPVVPGSGTRQAVPPLDANPAPAVSPTPTPPNLSPRGAMGPVPSSGRRNSVTNTGSSVIPPKPAEAGAPGGKPGSGSRPGTPVGTVPVGGAPPAGASSSAGVHFKAAPTGPGLDANHLFGGFQLLKELTIGGFGEVWIALDTATNKEVVIKRLKPEQAEFKRAFYQFDIEIEIGQRVKHPNLVPILQHGILDGRRFFTMPRVTGPSLTRILQKRAGPDWALTESEVLAALEMVGRALGFLHRAGVVHCDLKPDNILFAAHNKPMLIDLGIARTVNWEQTGYRALKGFREDNSILGTPEYMAPELFLGENEVIGFGADLYAMGVILYEVLTGHTPFKRDIQKAGGDENKALMDLMDAVQEEAPPELIEANPKAPPALAELTMQCLSKDPASRPKTADDFATAIGRVLRPVKLQPSAEKPSALGRLGNLIRKPGKGKK